MTPALSFLANHLWQSTLFAAVAGLLTLALRNNRAHVRYWLWFVASAKFLVPFAALMAVGSQFPRPSAVQIAQPEFTLVVRAVDGPLAAASALPFLEAAVPGPSMAPPSAPGPFDAALPWLCVVWICGTAATLLVWRTRWRRVAAVVRDGSPIEDGRELCALRRLERVGGVTPRIAVVATGAAVEPGVFGIAKPVLLWPRSIAHHLNDRQIEAILAHELSHVRRRDNLTAALHMVVQAVFWFHPLVWWLGARLVDERERACDEDVIRSGAEPQVYAEGILKTCEFYVELPLVCVTGVTGSDLKKRIEQIMQSQTAATLSTWKKLLLAASGIAAVVAPVVVGAATASPRRVVVQQRFVETRRVVLRTVHPEVAALPALPTVSQSPQPAARPAPAQGTTPILSGTLLGPRGATVADATIVLTHVDTNTDTTVRSNQAGRFERDLQTQRDARRDQGAHPALPIKTASPHYPQDLWDAKVEGSVVVEGRIGEDGVPTGLEVVAPVHPDLVKVALETVGQWRFEPAVQDGFPLSVPLKITINFRLHP